MSGGDFLSFSIELCMRWMRYGAVLLVALCWCCMVEAGTAGSFRGMVVEGEKGAPQEGWLYVQGRNGSMRRVDISKSAIAYDESVPADQRKSSAREQLAIGAEVRVTAEQDSNGEWHASRVEILKPAAAHDAAKKLGTS